MTILESGYLSDVKLFKGGFQILYMFQVGCHFEISSLIGTKKLVDHQLRVRTDITFFDPHIFGKDESSYECLVFNFILCSTEATTYSLLDEVPFG